RRRRARLSASLSVRCRPAMNCRSPKLSPSNASSCSNSSRAKTQRKVSTPIRRNVRRNSKENRRQEAGSRRQHRDVNCLLLPASCKGGIIMAKMFIAGESVDSLTGEVYEVRNPANGEVVDTVPKGNVEDARRAI